VDKKAVLEMEQVFPKKRTVNSVPLRTSRTVWAACGVSQGFFKVTPIGMIQDLISSRELYMPSVV
jgi:hypothetical protein